MAAKPYIVVSLGYETPCWIWQKCKVKAGYGRASLPGTRRVRYAHIVFYEKAKGVVPEGLQLDHLCRNRACVNPDHLEPVTQAENLRRGCRTMLTPDLIRRAKKMRSQGMLMRDISESIGVKRTTISHALCGTTWKGVA